MRIAIFGGTFNPVHNEHVNTAKHAIKELNLDKLFIVPAFLPPHKNVIPAPAEDRIKMLEKAFCDCEKAEVSDYEIKNGGKSYTYVTAEYFAEKYKDAELFVLVGDDMLTDFKTWKYPERILSVANLAVFGREEFAANEKSEREYFKKRFGKEFIRLSYTGKDDSSTEIRVRSALGLDISDKTPPAVAEYIKKNRLYSGGKYEDFVKKVLTEKRLVHTANVIVAALKKCKSEKIDEKKAYLAALLHDCAKYLNPDDYGFSVPTDVPSSVVHAFLGAHVAQSVLGIDDEEIIDAIRYHTSGKPKMSALGKLVFTADMIEKGRTYDGVEKLRYIYENESLDECFKACLSEEILHLKNKKTYIYIETLNAYEYYIKKRESN